ncbi:prolactin regulatory element-binding protein isoform X4 [Gracilinanus agilis]|uniref:prolactin regulatory element-binding protein isoform X4 n=1 Tax=Gracilinanus agilis TaxID=191870 RepID=UPI001CFDE1DC|nr:prolactin regulatory element-binding protein isoform X4 [Gracilinanus agilis]
MGRRRAPELYRAPFPLYALRVEPSTGLLITAGGGGAAKTGIKNGVHFLQLERIGGALSASLLHSHDTETKATMNLALAGNILAAGQDASCQLLQFNPQDQETSDKQDNTGSQEEGLRQRKGTVTTTETQESGASTQQEGVELNVENLQSVQTDFGSDPLQKTVCFNHDSTLLATGGTDGFVRVWQVPSLEKVLEFKAHEGEIEDLALGPGDKMVTTGWDFKACVWQRDQLVTGLRWDENLPPLPDTPYRYQACSESGTFLGLGTVTGSVAIYISFSLQGVSLCGCCCCCVLGSSFWPSCCFRVSSQAFSSLPCFLGDQDPGH